MGKSILDDGEEPVTKRHIRQGETEMMDLASTEFAPEHALALAFMKLAIRDAALCRYGARLWFALCPDQVTLWCDVLGLDAKIVQARVKALPAAPRKPLRKSRGKAEVAG